MCLCICLHVFMCTTCVQMLSKGKGHCGGQKAANALELGGTDGCDLLIQVLDTEPGLLHDSKHS